MNKGSQKPDTSNKRDKPSISKQQLRKKIYKTTEEIVHILQEEYEFLQIQAYFISQNYQLATS
jgi:hypothetical protein